MTSVNGNFNNAEELRAQALDLIRKMREQANVSEGPTNAPAITSQNPTFSQAVTNAISEVNQSQTRTDALRASYEQGDPSVSLSQVVLSSQESSVNFRFLLAVRNKAVEAYRDVMNMPI